MGNACKNGELKHFRTMQEKGLVPTIITYNTLLRACQKGNQLQAALEIFRTMTQQGVVPDINTYSAIISACEQSNE